MSDRLTDIATNFTSYLLVSMAAGVLWLIRRVLTNQAQIEMMQTELRHRDELRKADRTAMQEMRDEMREIRKDIQRLFERGHQ